MTSPASDYSDWIGRRIERQDKISERLIAEFKATFSPHLAGGDALPPGIHWCLSPDTLTMDKLGPDGHSSFGIYLPDVGLPRRMWAGGEIIAHGSFEPGDLVTRTNIIEDITFKSGKSGRLCFVKVRNHYSVQGKLVIDDRQDIVYRESGSSAAPTTHAGSDVAAAGDHWKVTPSPVMLFRYSAMSFNGHRIHYDEPYAREIEFYGGLVVHGPLQATLMLNLAASLLGRQARRFGYRGLQPLICGEPFTVDARPGADGSLETRVISAAGVVTMAGHAS
jgi:3-methylfumaryl-CoA hydratase